VRPFLKDFVIGLVVLPLATLVAVGISYLLLFLPGVTSPYLGTVAILGALLWLPIYYVIALV
jgi:hypothetical protein